MNIDKITEHMKNTIGLKEDSILQVTALLDNKYTLAEDLIITYNAFTGEYLSSLEDVSFHGGNEREMYLIVKAPDRKTKDITFQICLFEQDDEETVDILLKF